MTDLFITYLNTHTRQTITKDFTGVNAYHDAIKWGRANIDNFSTDLIQVKIS